MNLLNKKVPNFEQEATNNKTVSSSNIKGKNTVLFSIQKITHQDAHLRDKTFEIVIQNLKI